MKCIVFQTNTHYEDHILLANMELGDVMKQERAYTPKVQEAVEKIHAAMGNLQKVIIIHLFLPFSSINESDENVNFLENITDGSAGP